MKLWWGFIWIYRMLKGFWGDLPAGNRWCDWQLWRPPWSWHELTITRRVPRRYFASHQPKPVGASVSFALERWVLAEDHSATQKWLQLLFNWSLMHFVEKSKQLYTYILKRQYQFVTFLSTHFGPHVFRRLDQNHERMSRWKLHNVLSQIRIPKIMETDHPNFLHPHEIPIKKTTHISSTFHK